MMWASKVSRSTMAAQSRGVGEGAGPFNWNWLKFPIVVLSFDVLVLVSGVSA
jgi:hypothetical protein